MTSHTPWADRCAKCGSREGHDVQWVSFAMTLDGPGLEKLRLTCRFCHYEHDVPTMDATAEKPEGSPADDPMQATLTLGMLHKILDERDARILEQVRTMNGGGR